MITGLRASDAAVLQRLAGADQRLYLRLGALLQARLAISEAALAEAAGDAGLKKLLLDRRLKDATPKRFTALAAECGAAGSGVVLVDDSDGRTEAGWRVLVLEDELDNPLTADAEAKLAEQVAEIPAEANAVMALLPTLGPAVRAPVEVLLAARADDQRAAALEQLRYVAPPLAVVGELMPMLLADGADIVRERALGLMVASGAHVAVIDLVRALTRDDPATLARLGPVIARLPAVQVDLACAALIAVIGRGQATQAVVGVCVHLAQHLAAHRGLERLLELLLATKLNLVDLARALQSHDAARVDRALEMALGQGDASDARLISLLAGAHRAGDDRLLGRGVDLLLSPHEDPRERMALAIALRRLDLSRPAGVAGVAERVAAAGMALSASRDTSVYWLLAELSRDGRVDAATADTIADALRRILREGEGTHAIAIIDQQLPAHLPASDATKASLVEPIGELAARFRDDRTRDVVSTCLASIGLPAAPGLWRLIGDHPHQAVRLLAADVLPEVLERAGAAEARGALDRLLAIMDRSGNGAERAATLTAAARLAAGPALGGDKAATGLIDQATRRLGEWAVDALGWFAAGEHIDPARRIDIVEALLASVLADLPDTPLEHELDANTQETTFVLDARLGTHTESVPRALRALGRIAGSAHLPAPLTRRIVDQLCAQWKRVSTWEIVWGPANIQELGRTLAAMAARDGFPVALRIRVCEALVPSIGQLSIARALAGVFRHAEGMVADLAGRACARLIQLASGRHFADDEQDELAETLIDFLAVPSFGQSDDPLRRRLVGLVSATRAHLNTRARARLRETRATLPADLQQRLEWA
ncbi:MAG TPA: hypothetical protein VEL07_19550 [Planctomycetota bacterium]|nr:hypothetical protein [Planctomycetota bacterium]